MRAKVLLEVRTHIKLGSKILEQGLARPVRPAVSDHYRCSVPVTRTVSRMFYVSPGTAGLDQDINTGWLGFIRRHHTVSVVVVVGVVL